MDLTFRILWFENVEEWYKTTSRRISRYISNRNFKPDIKWVSSASHFNFSDEMKKYDLILVDYELEKVGAGGGEKRIYGQEIIKKLRKDDLVNDVLFYSSYGFDTIFSVMKEEGLQGVFVADRNNAEFIETVNRLIEKSIRRADNLVSIRGVVMDTTSGFDNMISHLISACWKHLGEKEAQISRDIKNKILEKKRQRLKQDERKVPKYFRIKHRRSARRKRFFGS